MYINAEFHESSRTFYLFKIEEDKNKFRTISFNKKKKEIGNNMISRTKSYPKN